MVTVNPTQQPQGYEVQTDVCFDFPNCKGEEKAVWPFCLAGRRIHEGPERPLLKKFPDMYHPTLRPIRQHVKTSVRPNRKHTKVKFRFHNLHLALSETQRHRLEVNLNNTTDLKRLTQFGHKLVCCNVQDRHNKAGGCRSSFICEEWDNIKEQVRVL